MGGVLNVQLVSGSNPPAQRRGVSLRAKAAANDRAEAWDHAVTKPRHCAGVSSGDSFAEIAEVVLFCVHVGCAVVLETSYK